MLSGSYTAFADFAEGEILIFAKNYIAHRQVDVEGQQVAGIGIISRAYVDIIPDFFEMRRQFHLAIGGIFHPDHYRNGVVGQLYR